VRDKKYFFLKLSIDFISTQLYGLETSSDQFDRYTEFSGNGFIQTYAIQESVF